MKNLTKQIFASIIMACSLLACSPTNDLINDTEEEAMVGKPMRRSAGGNIANALTFDSIAQVDAMLEAMQAVDDAETFYNTYLSNSNINNKYLTSIYEYLSILNKMDAGDSITAMLAFEALRDSMFNVYIDGTDTIAEPLACFDYRCLVNDDDIFVVDDRVYHLFDTIFITCPVDRHAELLEIANNRMRFAMLVAELKAEKIQFDSTMIQERGIYANSLIPDLEIVYVYEPTSGIHELNYEKIVGKHRMRVSINASENYVRFYRRHDFKTKYQIRSHNKWAGIWWIKNEQLNIDIEYLVEYSIQFDMILLGVDYDYTTRGLYPSRTKPQSIGFTDEIYIHTYGITNVDFTISNQYMTITEENRK